MGFSTSGPHQAETVELAPGLTVDGVRLFDVVQSTGNAWEQSAGAALSSAHDAGVHVVVKDALANGRLVRKLGDAGALAAVLAQPWADTVLLGAAGPEQLRSNLRCLEVAEPDVTGMAVEPGWRPGRSAPARRCCHPSAPRTRSPRPRPGWWWWAR